MAWAAGWLADERFRGVSRLTSPLVFAFQGAVGVFENCHLYGNWR